eukprot:scaffold93116_cov22-Cyclotella_meneghiniana.AAC.1
MVRWKIEAAADAFLAIHATTTKCGGTVYKKVKQSCSSSNVNHQSLTREALSLKCHRGDAMVGMRELVISQSLVEGHRGDAMVGMRELSPIMSKLQDEVCVELVSAAFSAASCGQYD